MVEVWYLINQTMIPKTKATVNGTDVKAIACSIVGMCTGLLNQAKTKSMAPLPRKMIMGSKNAHLEWLRCFESSPLKLRTIAINARARASALMPVSMSLGSIMRKIATGITKLIFDAIDATATPNLAVQRAIRLNRNRNPAPIITVVINHGIS